MHSDNKKRRSFVALLFAAGEVGRSVFIEKMVLHYRLEVCIFNVYTFQPFLTEVPYAN